MKETLIYRKYSNPTGYSLFKCFYFISFCTVISLRCCQEKQNLPKTELFVEEIAKAQLHSSNLYDECRDRIIYAPV